MRIRIATLADKKQITQIANQWPSELGFVRTDRPLQKRELYVTEEHNRIIGFVSFNSCADGWQTIHALGVRRGEHGKGVGRALLYAVPCPIRLKCPVDNAGSNRFYLNAGMRNVGVQATRTVKGEVVPLKRPLNLWEMSILNIIVRGNSKIAPEIARKSGSAYGFAEQDTAYDWPYMLDVNWTKPDWQGYMDKVRQHRPVQAMVTDYEAHIPKSTMLEQVTDLRTAGVLRILVCPKFDGATKDIPADCIVAVSVPTEGKLTRGANKYAGWMPNLAELADRKVHLLGGSPQLQKQTIVRLQGVGATVISVDGNAQFGAAARGSVYRDNKWNRRDGEKVSAHLAALMSSQNIQRELNSLGRLQQQPLFAV